MSRATDRAIVGVCLDGRQRSILEITRPSWERYAARYGLPLILIERDLADGNFYWNKHLLYRQPELKDFEVLLFLDNDILISPNAGSLLNDWNSPWIGAAFESTQSRMSGEAIAHYYDDYAVERTADDAQFQIINTGVLVIPREQAPFLEEVYARWQKRAPTLRPAARDRFARVADQPHVSYALQAAARFRDIGESFNTLWWKWHQAQTGARHHSFLLRGKAAAVSRWFLPARLWRTVFQRERKLFAEALASCDFLHVAGSKSPVFLAPEE